MAEKTQAQIDAEKAEALKKEETARKAKEAQIAKDAAAQNAASKGSTTSPQGAVASSGTPKPGVIPAANASVEEKEAAASVAARAGSPVLNSPGDTAIVEDVFLSADDVNSMNPGVLKPGEIGWLMLDDEGRPNGIVSRDPPAPGVMAARVVGTPTALTAELVTPSGAPITGRMNPEFHLGVDDAFLARNPAKGKPRTQEEALDHLGKRHEK